MNRPYTSAGYNKIVSDVREAVDGIGITTDVIVGFPGETDEMFENTCSLIQEANFSRLHVFRYSPRDRTAAASEPDQTPEEVKKHRSEKLMELGNSAMRRFAFSLIGKTLEVLAETASPNVLTGLTDNYVQVRFAGAPLLKGKVVRVTITELDQDGGAVGELREPI